MLAYFPCGLVMMKGPVREVSPGCIPYPKCTWIPGGLSFAMLGMKPRVSYLQASTISLSSDPQLAPPPPKDCICCCVPEKSDRSPYAPKPHDSLPTYRTLASWSSPHPCAPNALPPAHTVEHSPAPPPLRFSCQHPEPAWKRPAAPRPTRLVRGDACAVWL